MPKIKVKNIPTTARMRICYNNMCGCSGCSLNMKDTDIKCMITGKYNPEEKIVELSEQEFPTNREWMESLSNEELAALLTTGLIIHGGKYDGFKITNSLITDKESMYDWLSQPCGYLMEED